MKIAIPVAAYHPGNTADYVLRALQVLGHVTTIVPFSTVAESLRTQSFDFYFGVDSGEPANFFLKELEAHSLDNFAFWFIDYRHNKNRITRTPPDQPNAQQLHRKGGWIFQAQYEDYLECFQTGLTRSAWLPLAADPDIWNDKPQAPKQYDVGFTGNIWDQARADALNLLLNTPDLKLGFKGHGAAWKETAAEILRGSKVGFNINSFFGTAHAYDVNMRVFETLSCGIPLITNNVPTLAKLFPLNFPAIRSYTTLPEMHNLVLRSKNDEDFHAAGKIGREFILNNATYAIRMKQMLEIVGID